MDKVWVGFVIAVIVIFSYVGAKVIANYEEGRKECHVNDDCSEISYCGSDFKCHEFPNIETKIDFFKPALILGLSIVLAALILKKRS